MKLALISDIHGNLLALETVLQELEREGIERIVCLGDVAVMGPHPAAVIELLHTREIPCVMGNTDAWLLDPNAKAAGNPLIAGPERWCKAQLDRAQFEALRAYHATLEVELGREKLLAFHGSPRSFDDKIDSTTPREALEPMLSSKAPLMVGGHTHQQMLRRLDGWMLLNPGSVGLAYSSTNGGGLLARYAEYAVVDADHGHPRLELRRAPFDHLAVAQMVRESGMPHADYWANAWINAGT